MIESYVYCSMWSATKEKTPKACNSKGLPVLAVTPLVEGLGYESPLSPEAYQQLLVNLSNGIVEGVVVTSPGARDGIPLTPEQLEQLQEQEQGMANTLQAMMRGR